MASSSLGSKQSEPQFKAEEQSGILPHFTLVIPWQKWQDMDPTENALEGPTLWLPSTVTLELGAASGMVKRCQPLPSHPVVCLEPCLLDCLSCCSEGGVRACLPFLPCLTAVMPGRKSKWLVSTRRILLLPVQRPPFVRTRAGCEATAAVADMLSYLQPGRSCSAYSLL